MSKKLLMNNYSENGLMPVMDGLVCWLDGRDYDGTNSIKDRVSKKIFTCNNITNNKQAFVYAKSDSTIFAEFNASEAMYDLFNSDFTLCFEDKISRVISGSSLNYPSSYPRLIHFNYFSGNSPYQLSYNGETYTISGSRMTLIGYNMNSNDIFKSININYNPSKKQIVLVKKGNSISAYLDGKKYETVSDNKNTIINLERLTLGNTYLANRTYYGKIYSFMAYNRALTEEEIQQNYLYEQSIERGEVSTENLVAWDYEKKQRTLSL